MDRTLELLNNHASCRKFSGEPITEEQENLIVTTAQRSPTSSNIQAYSIIGVRNPEHKAQLALLSGDQDHIRQSSLFLVFCADLYRLSKLNEQRGYNFTGEWTEPFIVATVDAALAACRALISAQALGLGGVMVGAIRNNPGEVCELLSLPRLTYPLMGMSLGHPEQPPKKKPRLPVDGVYFKERYDESLFDQVFAEYDQTIDDVGYLRGREVRKEFYPDFDGLYSWSEHTARRMANDSPAGVRAHMMEFLKRRGFLEK